MSTRNEALCSPDSCINRAEPDEPVFTLRAHDPCAPAVVRRWAAFYVSSKGEWPNLTEAQRAKYQDAMRTAQQMEDYARARGWKPE